MTTVDENIKKGIRSEYEAARTMFHALVDSLSDEDMSRKSLNPGWTNGEILFHMTFAFMLISSLIPLVLFWGRLPRKYSKVFAGILNRLTGFFNWINAFGARGGGRIYGRTRIGQKFDKIHFSLLGRLNSTKESQWQVGMYYPVKWEALFSEYMTLADVFRYPVIHFKFHLNQISH